MYHWYEIDLSLEHDDHLEFEYFEPSQHSVAVTVYQVPMYVGAIDLLWYQFKFIPYIGCVNVALIPCSNDSWASFDE